MGKIGFGCVALSSILFEHQALALVETAFDNGILHFDTAPLYGRGYSEKILGKFLKGKRERVTITTKFGLGPNTIPIIPAAIALPLNKIQKTIRKQSTPVSSFSEPDLLSYRRIIAKDIKISLENSLKNLRTDYIDYFLLHEGMPYFLTDESLNYLTDLLDRGVVNKIGFSANYLNIINPIADFDNDWKILQYENSLLHSSLPIMQKYPEKLHIFHSVFSPLKYTNFETKTPTAILLAIALKRNPDGIVLFSSTQRKHISENILEVEKYNNFSLLELEKIIKDAIC